MKNDWVGKIKLQNMSQLGLGVRVTKTIDSKQSNQHNNECTSSETMMWKDV